MMNGGVYRNGGKDEETVLERGGGGDDGVDRGGFARLDRGVAQRGHPYTF